MNSQLTLIQAEQRIADLRRGAERAQFALGLLDRATRPRRGTRSAPENRPVTIRPAGSADLSGIREVARLDSQRPPCGPLLVAEVGDEIVAVLVISTAAVVANPFIPTADAVALLRLRAEQLMSEDGGRESNARPASPLAGATDPALRTQ